MKSTIEEDAALEQQKHDHFARLPMAEAVRQLRWVLVIIRLQPALVTPLGASQTAKHGSRDGGRRFINVPYLADNRATYRRVVQRVLGTVKKTMNPGHIGLRRKLSVYSEKR